MIYDKNESVKLFKGKVDSDAISLNKMGQFDRYIYLESQFINHSSYCRKQQDQINTDEQSAFKSQSFEMSFELELIKPVSCFLIHGMVRLGSDW